MTRTLRHTLTAVATLAFMSTFASSSFSQVVPNDPIHIQLVWNTSERQTFRVCLIGPATTSDESDSIIYVLDISAPPDFRPFLENEFRIRTGEFRCVDFPYNLLAEALREVGGEPEPTGAITFLVDIQSTSDARPPTRTIGAVINIDSKGRDDVYYHLQWAQENTGNNSP